MSDASGGHGRFRELISDRLDGIISAEDAHELRSHLALCPRCRMVARGYLRGRQLMRSLPAIPPPRDLWARTAAALDREVARHGRPRRAAWSADSGLVRLAALGSLVIALAVVGSQLGISAPVSTPNGPNTALATPFDVPTQELAFVEVANGSLEIYQTTVDHACPPAEIDCAGAVSARLRVVAVPGALSARTVDLHQPDGHLALLTRDVSGIETLSVVLLEPATDFPPPVTGPDRSTGPGGGSGRPEASPTRSAVSSPDQTTAPGSTRRPSGGGGTSEPTDRAATAEPPEPTEPGTPPSEPTEPNSSEPESTVPEPTAAERSSDPTDIAVVHEVLPNVHLLGAPPAWSADGETLAFSAARSDGSGPDLYIWRTSDARATRITKDGATYFASWAGPRLVASRLIQDAASETDGPARAHSVVIDPLTSGERAIEQDGLWLPQVDPRQRSAIAWRGQLDLEAGQAVADRGALYLIDWRALDPFAPRAENRVTTDEPASEPSASDLPASDPTAAIEPSASNKEDDQTPSASHWATEPVAKPRPMEPARDPGLDPVREWYVRWSGDGSTVAYWVADSVGASWGQLSVVRLARDGQVDRSSELLAPTLARRAFALGQDRVAWIAPSPEQVNGELRLRTWGLRGYGSLRLSEIQVRSGTPAF